MLRYMLKSVPDQDEIKEFVLRIAASAEDLDEEVVRGFLRAYAQVEDVEILSAEEAHALWHRVYMREYARRTKPRDRDTWMPDALHFDGVPKDCVIHSALVDASKNLTIERQLRSEYEQILAKRKGGPS
jgi:hypothetical protein